MYEIFVFGKDLEDVESVGGWQSYMRTSSKEFAYTVLENLRLVYSDEDIDCDFPN